MDIDVALLAAQVATFLAPHLIEAAKGVGKAVGKKLTDKVADTIWGKLTGSSKKEELKQAAEVKEDGSLDTNALAHAIAEALEAEPALRQSLEVHGDVLGNVTLGGRDVYQAGRDIVFNLTAGPPRRTETRAAAPIFPPSPYYAHPFGGTDFTGRAAELAMLDEWTAQDGKPVMAWVAIGGMGKSALAWHWVRLHAHEYEGLLWWSFYDATFTGFLDEAIAYLSSGKVDAAKLQGGQKVPVLTNLLREGRYLLALDGFERELDAYRGMKAAYQDDSFEDQPPEAGEQRLECIDPQARVLLQAIGALTELPSKVLITSRLFPNTLADRNHTQLDGVRHEHLTGLKRTDAVALFHKLGITGPRAEIEAAASGWATTPSACGCWPGASSRTNASRATLR